MKKPTLKFTPDLKRRLKLALYEDLGSGDITTRLVIPKHIQTKASIIAKEPCTVAGLVLLPQIFKQLNPKVKVKLLKKDGDFVKKGQTLVRILGPAQAVLTAERLALNFLSRLSGISTLTHHYVKKTQALLL